MSKTVFFGNASAYTSAANPALLAAGEIGVYSIATDGSFTLITTTASATQKQLPIMIAQGGVTGGNFKQVIVYPNCMVSAPATATAYIAAVPNVYNVGYAGSGSDTIQASVAGTYDLTVTNTTKGTIPLPYNFASTYYTTAALATPFAVAYDWAKLINIKTLNTGLKPYDRFVFASVLTDQSSTQLATSAPANITGTVVTGSTNVTFSGAPATALTAGQYLRIGHATTTTLPVYKIATVTDTTHVILDAPYVNGSVAIGTSISSVALGLLDATPDVSDLAGVRLVSFGNWFDGSSFKEAQPNGAIAVGVNANALGTVIVHNGTTARSYVTTTGAITTGVFSLGYGIGYMAQKDEYEYQGYQGNMNRSWLPYATQYFAASGSVYDGYTATYMFYPHATGDGLMKGEKSALLFYCVNAGGSGTVSTNALVTAKIPTILASYVNA